MSDWIEHGTSAYRLPDGHAPFTFDGRFIVGVYPSPYPHRIGCIDADDGGRAHVGALASGVTAHRDRAVSWLGNEVRVHELPSLAITKTFTLEAPVLALAAGDRTIAAAHGTSLSLIDPDRGDVRMTALAEKPSCVAMSSDGSRVAIGTDNEKSGSVIVVDVADAAIVWTLKGARAPIGQVAWSSDGAHVAACASKTVLAWPILAPAKKAKAPKPVTGLRAKKYARLIGASDAAFIATSMEERLVAFDPATGSERWSIEQYGPAAVCGDRVLGCRFGTLHDIEAATGNVRRKMDAGGTHFRHAALSKTRIVTGGFGARVRVLEDEDEWSERETGGHDQYLHALSFDGDRFATSAHDGRVLVWRQGQREAIAEHWIRRARHTHAAHAIHLEGDQLYTTFDRGVQRFRVGEEQPLAETKDRLKDDVTIVLPLPSAGLVLATAEATRRTYGELYLLDAETLAIVHEERLDRTFVRAQVMDGDRVRLWGGLSSIVLDLGARAIIDRSTVRTADLSRRSFVSDDGALLIETDTRPKVPMGPRFGWIHGHDLARDAPLYERIETTEIWSSALASSGMLATGHADRVRVWSTREGKLVEDLPYDGPARGVAWSPDGRTLVAWRGNGALHSLSIS